MKEIIDNLPVLTPFLASITDMGLKLLDLKKAMPAKQKEINTIGNPPALPGVSD
jgi:hypothetical protein